MDSQGMKEKITILLAWIIVEKNQHVFICIYKKNIQPPKDAPVCDYKQSLATSQFSN